MIRCGGAWKKLSEIYPGLGQCPCTTVCKAECCSVLFSVTCSSLSDPELCTQHQHAGSHSAESALVCRGVWLL